MIDLHSHTTASDGQHSPAELLEIAAKAGVKTLAVTDHDTVSGLAACATAAATHGLTLINGIEISIRYHGREVHILGHFIDPENTQLASFSTHLRAERKKRMVEMVGKMQKLGFPVTMEQVEALAGDGHLTRPHLARVLVELNYCSSTKEAFDRFLGDGKAAAAPRFEVTLAEAITLIHGAGGTATLAHPGVSRIERHELTEMASAGLDGIEVVHSDHPPSKREQLAGWARDLKLVPTAGTDFHGHLVAPGRIFGKVSMTEAELSALKSRRP